MTNLPPSGGQHQAIIPTQSPLTLLTNHTNSIHNQNNLQSSPNHLHLTTSNNHHQPSQNNQHHQLPPIHQNSPLSLGGLNLSSGGCNSSSNSSISLSTSGLNLSSGTSNSSNDGRLNNLGLATTSSSGDSGGINNSGGGGGGLTSGNNSTNLMSSDLVMSHWINETSVKTEIRSPGLDSANLAATTLHSVAASAGTSHLDPSLFCGNSTVGLETVVQGTNSYEHNKQDYYNYYNSMQQYTPPFYSSYSTPYPARTTTKLPSPNTYLPSSYATNNNSAQLYPTYGYNNFGQFGPPQQDFSSYYNDQYSSYYNTAGYSPYVSSPGSSGSQTFHVATGLPGMIFHCFFKFLSFSLLFSRPIYR